jgi:hypothetical protein
VGLVVGPRGERLAKRDGAVAIEAERLSGCSAGPQLRRLARSCGLPDTEDLHVLAEALVIGPGLARPAPWSDA